MIKVLENEADFANTLESDKKVLVDFNAKWCGPCRRMGRRIEGLEEDYKDLTFLKVDTDEYPELAQKFGVVSIPRMVAFKDGKRIYVEKDGVEDEIILGARPEPAFRQILTDTFEK